MLFITYIFILAVFILLSYTLYKIAKLYFDFKSKGQESKHYPITLGITFLSIPLISSIFSIPSYLIKVFNQYTSLNLPMPKDDWKSMVLYTLYVFAVIALSYIYYKLQPRDEERFRDEGGSQKISYPDNTKVVVSPHLHKRIQELFELKYEKLKLSYDAKEKLLVGHYSDAIHSYRYFIYCDSKLKNISKDYQAEVLEHLKELSDNFVAEDNTFYEPKYLFFIEEGTFEENDNKYLKCYTENTFLNVIIDFSSYLQKNIDRFDTQSIDIGGVSLKESFIEPSFNKGETNLKLYFDEWLEEKSLRHISLLADYGMGKTSFLKYYTKYLSQKILEGESFSRYPIFISLTNTSPMSNDGIETKIESFVSKELGVPYALFERLVYLGKIVFVLDGFDEMGFIGTAKTRFEQFNSIWQLATSNNKILISGRPSYLPTDFERKNVLNIVDSSVTDVQLTPFTEVIELDYFKLEQIEQTVNIYYQGKEVEQYMNYIKYNRSILDLCKRPSMLHMTMSILPELYSEDSPKVITSSDIMNKYTEYWISRQESKAITGYFSKNDNRKKEFLINFFMELSGEMYKRQTMLFPKKWFNLLIIETIEKYVPEIILEKEFLDGFISEVYTGYFVEIDIRYSNGEYIQFVHKSIFEFFVSKRIIQLIKEKNFNDSLMLMNWDREIIDFIDNTLKNKSPNLQRYPSLINLKNSFLDKVVIKYLEKDILSKYSDNVMHDIGDTWFATRVRFIKNAYYMHYKNNYFIPPKLLNYFINNHRLFINTEALSLSNLKLNNMYIVALAFTSCNLEKTSFMSSKIKYLKFSYSFLTFNRFFK